MYESNMIFPIDGNDHGYDGDIVVLHEKGFYQINHSNWVGGDASKPHSDDRDPAYLALTEQGFTHWVPLDWLFGKNVPPYIHLKPCPFCGSKAEIETYEPCDDYPNNQTYRFAVSCTCSGCGITTPSLHTRFKTEEEAELAIVAVWNRRY